MTAETSSPKWLLYTGLTVTTQWCATLHLKGKNKTLTSDAIKFLKGIFQGDSLSVLLFILTVNPLSFMLRNIKGYSYRIERTNDITQFFCQ